MGSQRGSTTEHAEAIKEFIAQSENADITLEKPVVADKGVVAFLKGSMKEVKGKHLLIHRYQLK